LPDEVALEERLPLSALLLTLADRAPGPVSLVAVVEHFGARAFGGILFIFAIPNLLPLPPGSSTVLSLPLLLIAPQLAFGADWPWLPHALARRTVDHHALAGVCRRAAPWVARAERLTTRRFVFLFGPFGDAIIGVVCTLLAAVLILPIPLGNMLPAAAVATLALSLVQRDGLLAILGYGMAFASAAVLTVSGHLVVAAVARLGAMTDLW
jgi:hypothetical protein